MPQNNLRVIYENLVDATATSISASTTFGGTSVNNLKNDTKSSVWKATGISGTLTIDFGSTKTVGGVIAPYCSLSSTATIRVVAWSGANGTGSTIYDTGTISACPVTMPSDIVATANNFAYGTSRVARAWFDTNYAGVRSVVITFTDTGGSNIELGKLIIGAYWSAVCNTKFGLGTEFADMTVITRLDSGDANVASGPRYRKMSFEMAWLLQQDRPEFRRILQRNGTKTPMFVSLFPQIAQVGEAPTVEEYDLEHTHCIYGRMSQISQLINSTFTVHANSVELEEV